MLQWFEENPEWYWLTFCAVIAPSIFILLRPMLKPGWDETRGTDWRWSLVILALLVAGRWPTWVVPQELNVDESVFLAGASTLRGDPVFWRSVDGSTSGPLNFYALFPAGWIHGVDDYFSARLTALCLIAAALSFAHQGVALVFGRQTARATGFAAICFEALTQNPELVHYSSELVSMSLLSAAIFLGVRRFATGSGWGGNLAGGLLLGAVPFAKLQAAPMAAMVGAGWLAGEWWLGRTGPARRRHVPALLIGAAAPLLACACALTFTGQWRNAVISYLRFNVAYADDASMTLRTLFVKFVGTDDSLFAWLAGTAGWLLLIMPLPRATDRFARLAAAAAIVFSIVSLGCILVPHRPYPHYFQLFVVPLILVVGAATGLVLQALPARGTAARRALLGAALICTTGGVLSVQAQSPNRWLTGLAAAGTQSAEAVVREIGRYARPGETLGIWGWMSSYYVGSGLRQATRDADFYHEIHAGPWQDFYRTRYLDDLRRSAPPVFVDAVGRSSRFFKDRRFAHDAVFPALAAYIREHYTRVAEIDGSRIYVRNDRRPVGATPDQ